MIRRTTHLLVAMGMLLLAGCAAHNERWQHTPGDRIEAELADAARQDAPRAPAQVPAAVSRALMPPLTIQSTAEDEAARIEPRFDLAANRTPARAVFLSLVEDTPYSMVVHPDVSGLITMQLKNVTVEEAMDAIRRVYGYEYRRQDDRYLVLGRGLQTRIFPVNYLDLNRKGHSDTRVSSGELTRALNQEDERSASGGKEQTHGIRVETRSDTDFWKGLEKAINGIVGETEGRRVVVNPQSGVVVVRAMPAELDIVESFLGITQDSINRQVVLEAKIIEVELRDGYQSGINWAKLGSSGDTDFMAGQIGGGTLLSGLNASELAGQTGNLQPDGSYAPLPGGVTSGFGGMFSLSLKARNFAAFIELLQTQGDVHVLSSPRVSTVNNQKAVIKVGGDEFFVTGVSQSSTITGATTTLAPEVELTPFFSGIALDVTPQIDADGNIILHIHPSVSNVAQRDKSFTISGENFSLPLAFSTIQESDNVVRAGSGQVIVIGGLMKEASTENAASVPVLGDIPVVGRLFRHEKVSRIKKELIILLKPSVVDGGEAWQAMAIPRGRGLRTVGPATHTDKR